MVAAPASAGRSQFARIWRRKGLKRLIPRPEMVAPREPQTPKIWRRSAPGPSSRRIRGIVIARSEAMWRSRVARQCWVGSLRSVASRPEMAPQRLEKIDYAPGNGRPSREPGRQDESQSRGADHASPDDAR